MRIESADGKHLLKRAKIVHPDFLQSVNEGVHWSRRSLQQNSVRIDLWPELGRGAEREEEEEEGLRQQQQQQQQQQNQSCKQRDENHRNSSLTTAGSTVICSTTAGSDLTGTGRASSAIAGIGCNHCHVCFQHGVVCLVGPSVDALASDLELLAEVPETAQMQR